VVRAIPDGRIRVPASPDFVHVCMVFPASKCQVKADGRGGQRHHSGARTGEKRTVCCLNKVRNSHGAEPTHPQAFWSTDAA
jgi:hypothetical protein